MKNHSRFNQKSTQFDRFENLTSDYIDTCVYSKAEKRAKWYLTELQQVIAKGEYLDRLRKDYVQWAKHYTKQETVGLSTLEAKFETSIQLTSQQFVKSATDFEYNTQPHTASLQLSKSSKKSDSSTKIDSWTFLEKLIAERKLNRYLHKSIAYIFMRDLGQSLNHRKTRKDIAVTVKQISRWIRTNVNSHQRDKTDEIDTEFNQYWLLKKAKQYGVEDTCFWLINKLSKIQNNLPQGIDATHAMRKLVKIIAGVVLHQLLAMPADLNRTDRRRKLAQAIKLGYSYGLTYPFIDDLQDSATALSQQEKQQFNQAIRQSLIQGKVVTCPPFRAENQAAMRFVYQSLSEAFETIKTCLSAMQAKQFFEQAYIFFEAQDIDRQRSLNQSTYSLDELFLPVILKSAGCRLIAKEIVSCQVDENFNYHTFCFGIYNQFNDDIKDIFDDLAQGNLTPYTYYYRQVEETNTITQSSQSLTNPYLFYWAVVYYLIYHVYQNQPQAKQLLLERSINAHKSLLNALGNSPYQRLSEKLLVTDNIEFNGVINQLVRSPNDVAWFDKLISREVARFFTQSNQQKVAFRQKYQTIKNTVDKIIPLTRHAKLENSQLEQGCNYSLRAGGKRMRSVLAYMMCVEEYGFAQSDCVAVLQMLEYMHTASIIFDDKPSQDNADFRRGQPSLHHHYQSEAFAELSGVYLMMRAVEVQSQMDKFDAALVLKSLSYAASITQAICEGQWLDLQSDCYQTDVQHLTLISELKTALAIEASLVIPAILAGENDINRQYLKQFAYHLGLAFQIKDDLLDFQGCSEQLGKPVNQDNQIQKASFVTCLGENGALQKLYHHHQQASELLVHFKVIRPFMRQLTDFVIYRDR
ncbi:polyprenyl synthetase family protein [Aliikangiella maris]|uniref:Polyprenyl synthetase family protein n=2 Tax=Aliikangiella maris TaxID=3162458 RepID=A0ABV3MK01_9GAMM